MIMPGAFGVGGFTISTGLTDSVHQWFYCMIYVNSLSSHKKLEQSTSTRGGGILIWIAVQSQQTGGIRKSHLFLQVQAAADLHPKRRDRHRRSFDG